MNTISSAFVLAFAALLATTSLYAQSDTYSAQDKAWYTIETEHFLVHYHEGTERTARVAAKIGEEIYGPVTTLYSHEPDTKVSFVIKDLADYSNGAAYFFNNKVEIWTSPLDFELRGTHNWLRNVIAHEYTHIIQIQSAMKWGRKLPAITLQWFGYEKERRTDVLYGFPNLLVSYPLPGVIVPPWMAEGTAQYMRYQFGYENWDAHRDMILRCYVLSDSMLTWSEMGAFGKTSLGNESVYNAGYNFSRFIAKTYGEEKLVEITRALSKPFVFTIESAFDDVLGKSGGEVYAEWKSSLQNEYRTRIAPVKQNRVSGNLIADVGFGNFHPVYSPDEKSIAYVSNKTADYFGQSGLYIYNRETKEEKAVAAGMSSTLSWSPDGKQIVYSKHNPPRVTGEVYYDLHRYDFDKDEETPVTHGLRANNPSYSPDGQSIAFVFENDGSVNIGVVNMAGKEFRRVTNFENGEQAFNPQWSPDGTSLVFGYAAREQRSVASVKLDGTGFSVIAGSPEYDCRNPRYSHDAKYVYYAGNKTGIFNIYRFELETGAVEQLTNVIGGAFMPDIDSLNNLVYAEYTSAGYKIALLPDAKPLQGSNIDYLPAKDFAPIIASADSGAWDWNALQHFDDRNLPEPKARKYTNVFQSMMFFPTLRIDEYNPDNHGLELFKPGLMMYSSDMLNRVELMAAGSINTKMERDLYMNFTFRGPMPLFSSFNVFPDFTFEVYNVTRSTNADIAFPLDTVGVDVDFNLLEFAISLKHPIFSKHTMLDIGYNHSRYTSTVGGFEDPESSQLYPAIDNLYFVGNDIHVHMRHDDILPTRDGEINPVGWRLSLFYDYEFNNYNPGSDYELDESSGRFVPVYTDVDFHRMEGNLFIANKLPWWDHTLSVRLRAGSILGPTVDPFFDFYAGGITGMQGYTFYALGGNELVTANVTYRFPIIKSMDLHLGHILFDKLYAGIFADAGDANSTPEEFTVGGLKRDVGFELRLESYSFAMYPTRIFFSGAYGLDEFTRTFSSRGVDELITYGKEWRWYFGVLFSFNLSDKL